LDLCPVLGREQPTGQTGTVVGPGDENVMSPPIRIWETPLDGALEAGLRSSIDAGNSGPYFGSRANKIAFVVGHALGTTVINGKKVRVAIVAVGRQRSVSFGSSREADDEFGRLAVLILCGATSGPYSNAGPLGGRKWWKWGFLTFRPLVKVSTIWKRFWAALSKLVQRHPISQAYPPFRRHFETYAGLESSKWKHTTNKP
jgi:hypothetical protein